jgi:uncharacterized protein YkwD
VIFRQRPLAFPVIVLTSIFFIANPTVPAGAHTVARRVHANAERSSAHAHARRVNASAHAERSYARARARRLRARARARHAHALARHAHALARHAHALARHAHALAKHAHALARRAQADARRRRHRRTPNAATQAPQKQSSKGSTAAVLANVLRTPCQNTELTPTPQNIEAVTLATLCLVNQERARNGELPLQTNGQLEKAAVEHSEEMVSQDYFAHIAPDGLTPLERVEATGYIPNHEVGYTVGENIAWGTLQLSTPSAIVAAWIASPEHLANILDASYKETAVGVVPAVPSSLSQGQPGAIYSQEFGVIVYG